MRHLILVLVLVCAAAIAQPQNPTGDIAAIRAVITEQTAAWNRGDITAFMHGYENSPDTTFVGISVRKGYDPILKRYQANYTSAAQMGTLSFTNLDVRLSPSSCGSVEYAVVTGNFHLERAQKGAATRDDGIFSLVWRKGPQRWKIVLDRTS